MSTTTAVTLRQAIVQDARAIRALLESNDLPTDDLTASSSEFVVACEDGRIVGIGALERFGEAALLRSVAVETKSRGIGMGRQIVMELERRAKAAGIGELILLTLAARDFFESLGYRAKDRTQVPPAVLGSAEFRSLCPASAICMAKSLAPN